MGENELPSVEFGDVVIIVCGDHFEEFSDIIS